MQTNDFNPDQLIAELAQMFFDNKLTLGEVIELQETLLGSGYDLNTIGQSWR